MTNIKSSIVALNLNTEAIIYIDRDSMDRYKYLVNQVSPNEVQWYCIVNRVITQIQNSLNTITKTIYSYHISDMMIPKQEVSRLEVDSNPNSMFCIFQELKIKYANDSSQGFDMTAVNNDLKRMHVWCHSHPFSSDPKPSGTDVNTFQKWISENQISQNIDSPMIMLIFGNGSKIYTRVFDPRLSGTMFINVPVVIKDSENIDTTYIDDAIENKITKQSNNQMHHINSTNRNWLVKQNNSNKKNLFDKNFPGNWPTFLEELNCKSDNKKEVTILWTFISRYLKTNTQATMFILALDDESLLIDLVGGCDPEIAATKTECLKLLIVILSSVSVSSEKLHACLTFSRRFSSQKDDNGRKKSIDSFIRKLEEISELKNLNELIDYEDYEDYGLEQYMGKTNGYNPIGSQSRL